MIEKYKRKLEVWYSPWYYWYKIKRRFNHYLYLYSLKDGKCAGCGEITRNGYDSLMKWHVCGKCEWTTESIANDLVRCNYEEIQEVN